MSWFGKIFKGSSDKIPGGHYRENHGLFPNHGTPSSSGDTWSRYENEDIDRAIALSLAEENQIVRSIPGKCFSKLYSIHKLNKELFLQFCPKSDAEFNTCTCTLNFSLDKNKKSQLEEDEQVARAIQETLNFKSSPRGGNVYAPIALGNDLPYQPNPYYYSTGHRICAGCKREIGHVPFLSCLNAFWHPECFRCHGCGLPISDYEFSVSGNSPYHKTCYMEHHYPKCDVCKHFMPTNSAGLVEYRAHPFWMQKYCPNHEHDGTPCCCSCERMEPQGTDYVHLTDGRKLCLECLDSAFMDTSECQPLYHSIQRFYEDLNMKVEQRVPLLLVERQALNEAREGERNGHYHMPETRGLCLSEERMISSISRQPRIRGGRAMDMITEPFKLTRFCEVTAILVLYGFPRLLTGSILAHEMMHAWLRLKGFHTLRQDVEEGICQVIAYTWLDKELSSPSGSLSSATATATSSFGENVRGPRTQFERNLGEFFKHQIESDRSPVYGDGFRAGRQAVQRYGLKSTLDNIYMTGDFPR